MNEVMVNILVGTLNIADLLILVFFLRQILDVKQRKKIIKYTFFIIVLLFYITINVLFSNLGIALIFGLVVYFVISLLLYEGKFHIKFIVIMFYFFFSFISELFAALLMTAIFGNMIQDVRENAMYMFLGGLASKIILLLLIEVIVRFVNKKASKVSIGSLMMILSIPLASVALSIISVYRPIVEEEYSIMSGIACIIILYIDIMAFYLFDNIILQVDENNHYRIRESAMKLQQQQYILMIKGYEDVKKIRHDMIVHLIALDGYYKNNQPQIASEYICKLHSELNLGIQGVISENVVVDAIINNREALMKQKNIKYKHEVFITPTLRIKDMDLSIILGNLINNAIEACERIEEGGKEISLKMKCFENNLVLEIKNTCDISTIRKKNGKFISSKLKREKNGFGFGMGNIEEIVRKYNGIIKSEIKDELFVVDVLIPN